MFLNLIRWSLSNQKSAQRVVFDQINAKLARDLHEKKKEMAKIIEVSNVAYEARDQVRIFFWKKNLENVSKGPKRDVASSSSSRQRASEFRVRVARARKVAGARSKI